MVLLDEKTGGRKSRDTAPLRNRSTAKCWGAVLHTPSTLQQSLQLSSQTEGRNSAYNCNKMLEIIEYFEINTYLSFTSE
jgi:hypothetical protein